MLVFVGVHRHYSCVGMLVAFHPLELAWHLIVPSSYKITLLTNFRGREFVLCVKLLLFLTICYADFCFSRWWMIDKASLQNLKLSKRMQFLLFPERCDIQIRVWVLEKWRDVGRYGELTRIWKKWPLHMLYKNKDVRYCQIQAIRALGSDRYHGIKNLYSSNRFSQFCFWTYFLILIKTHIPLKKPVPGYAALTTVARLGKTTYCNLKPSSLLLWTC